MKREKGRLYVIGTPIGNLSDITQRALKVLRDVDVIITENKKRSLKLLNFYKIRKHLISLTSYSEERKLQSLLNMIEKKECALISSAGTPCISDPGKYLVRACYERDIEVRVVPGPSALSASISISGAKSDKFFFFGFLPQKKSKKEKVLAELSDFPFAIIFFESPRKLLETIELFERFFHNREIVVIKEMTKIHEKRIYGTPKEILNKLKGERIAGEFTIIVDKEEKRE